MRLQDYQVGDFYDEMFEAPGKPRPGVAPLVERLAEMASDDILQRQKAAELSMMRMGITFNVYSDNRGVEKTFPFDLIPRIVSAKEWDVIEKGLKQRIRALNLFIDDLYHDRKIISDKIIPEAVLRSSKGLRSECLGLDPPRGIWMHITGTDLVRHSDGQIYVLEDNLRCPSGVSYVLENRHLMKNLFPSLFEAGKIKSVDSFPYHFRDALDYLMADTVAAPKCVVLTPDLLT